MTAITGLSVAAAFLLLGAGVGKTVRPGPAAAALVRARIPGRAVLARRPAVRLYGLLETALALVVVTAGGRVAAALLVIGFVGLVGVAARIATRAPGSACGCFGGGTDRVGPAHLIVTTAAAAVGVASWWWPATGLPAAFAAAPATTAATVLAAGVLALAAYAALAALPALQAARRAVVAQRAVAA